MSKKLKALHILFSPVIAAYAIILIATAILGVLTRVSAVYILSTGVLI